MPPANKNAPSPSGTWQAFARMIRFFTSPASVILMVFLVVALLTGEAIAVAAVQRSFIDALVSRSTNVVLASGLGLVLLAVFYMVLVALWQSQRASYVGDLAANMRNVLVRRLFALPAEEAEQVDPGAFGSWATSDIESASQLLAPAYSAVLAMSRAVAASVYMVVLDRRLGVMSAILCPLIVWLGNKLSAPMSVLGEEVQESLARVSSYVSDCLANNQVIRVFGLEPEIARRFRLVNEDAYSVNRGLTLRMAWVEAVIWFFAGAPLVIPFVYGGYLAFRGLATVGTVLAVVNLSNYTRSPLAQVGKELAQLRRCIGSGHKVLDFITGPENTLPCAECSSVRAGERGSFAVENLSFRYPGAERDALASISLSISPGVTAIVGESGSGKTTLLKIAGGIYRVSCGGEPFTMPPTARICYVPQEPFLFPGSILENLLLGRRGAGSTDLDFAIKAACAEFVHGLHDGLATSISERGRSLSGGERTRIAIAMALATDPDVLLLDEPGAGLDARTEKELWRRLRVLMAQRTLVVVTHRLSELRPSDRVVMLDHSHVVGQGLHGDLVETCEAYRQMYRHSEKEAATGALG